MNVGEAQIARNALKQTIGKAALQALYPNDFELYMCAFELLDSKMSSLAYFIFPVMPDSISIVHTAVTTVTKTAGGITVLSTPNFNPGGITINGTFGRNFKTLLGDKYMSLVSGYKNFGKQGLQLLRNTFDLNVKTGYGCCKVLDSIIEESRLIDESGPRYLIFYNLAFNENYVVEVPEINWKMSPDQNMIWSYSLSMTTVAPLDSFNSLNKRSQLSLTVDSYLQKNLSQLSSVMSDAISKKTNNGRSNRKVLLSSTS